MSTIDYRCSLHTLRSGLTEVHVVTWAVTEYRDPLARREEMSSATTMQNAKWIDCTQETNDD